MKGRTPGEEPQQSGFFKPKKCSSSNNFCGGWRLEKGCDCDTHIQRPKNGLHCLLYEIRRQWRIIGPVCGAQYLAVVHALQAQLDQADVV